MSFSNSGPPDAAEIAANTYDGIYLGPGWDQPSFESNIHSFETITDEQPIASIPFDPEGIYTEDEWSRITDLEEDRLINETIDLHCYDYNYYKRLSEEHYKLWFEGFYDTINGWKDRGYLVQDPDQILFKTEYDRYYHFDDVIDYDIRSFEIRDEIELKLYELSKALDIYYKNAKYYTIGEAKEDFKKDLLNLINTYLTD